MHQLLLFATVAIFEVVHPAFLNIPSTLADYTASSYEQKSAMPYIFGYSVIDGQSNSNYDHHETSDAKRITGSYRVVLPDGRTQIVNENGYVADVKYKSIAKYPQHRKPSYQSLTSN